MTTSKKIMGWWNNFTKAIGNTVNNVTGANERIQGEIGDAEKAGINPLAIATGGISSPGGGTGDPSQIAGNTAKAAGTGILMKKQIAHIDSAIELNKAKAAGITKAAATTAEKAAGTAATKAAAEIAELAAI